MDAALHLPFSGEDMFRLKYLLSMVRLFIYNSLLSPGLTVSSVTFGGAILFLLFGFIYLYQAFTLSAAVDMAIPISVGSQPGV